MPKIFKSLKKIIKIIPYFLNMYDYYIVLLSDKQKLTVFTGNSFCFSLFIFP